VTCARRARTREPCAWLDKSRQVMLYRRRRELSGCSHSAVKLPGPIFAPHKICQSATDSVAYVRYRSLTLSSTHRRDWLQGSLGSFSGLNATRRISGPAMPAMRRPATNRGAGQVHLLACSRPSVQYCKTLTDAVLCFAVPVIRIHDSVQTRCVGGGARRIRWMATVTATPPAALRPAQTRC
jgi:hypothetical protein